MIVVVVVLVVGVVGRGRLLHFEDHTEIYGGSCGRVIYSVGL